MEKLFFFSNGLLDPWSAGGVLKSLSDSLVSIVIEDGAHHLDLRHSNAKDPPSVIEARKQEREYLASWISEYHRKNSQKKKQNDVQKKNKDTLRWFHILTANKI